MTFEVVTVPDFEGNQAHLFEARTLLFLAFWLEAVGQDQELALQLACIGEPPRSVRWLAERANARISLHKPFPTTDYQFPNKLRGLEALPGHKQVVLVDVDVLVLAKPTDLTQFENCIAAAPTLQPWVPNSLWPKLYEEFGLNLNVERVPSLRTQLSWPPLRWPQYPEQNVDAQAMFPYYSSGVVSFPGDSELRLIWPDYTRRCMVVFKQWHNPNSFFEEIGLALAIERLKQGGQRFGLLPAAYHARWPLVCHRAVSLPEVVLFHAIGLFKNMPPNADPGLYLLGYYRHLLRQTFFETRQETGWVAGMTAIRRYGLSAIVNSTRLIARMDRLYRQYCGPAYSLA